MSVRLYTQEEIVNHPQNTSDTKYMYSFGKAKRFRTIDRTGKSDSLYILPSTKMTRNTALGYGTKYDFFKENHKITEFISIKRSYDKNFSPGYKYSFGLGREKFTKKAIPGYKIIDDEIPGPAKYNVLKTIGGESPKYTFRKLCGKTFWVNKYMDNPSAAEYSLPSSINAKGKFINSKIPDIKGAAFSKDHTNRWNYYKGNNVPGPNAYSLNKALMGNLYNSKYRSGPYIEMHKKSMADLEITQKNFEQSTLIKDFLIKHPEFSNRSMNEICIACGEENERIRLGIESENEQISAEDKEKIMKAGHKMLFSIFSFNHSAQGEKARRELIINKLQSIYPSI